MSKDENQTAFLQGEVSRMTTELSEVQDRCQRAEQRCVQLEQTILDIPGHRKDLSDALKAYSAEANNRIISGMSGREGVDFRRGPKGERLSTMDDADVRNLEVRFKCLEDENAKLRKQLKG